MLQTPLLYHPLRSYYIYLRTSTIAFQQLMSVIVCAMLDDVCVLCFRLMLTSGKAWAKHLSVRCQVS